MKNKKNNPYYKKSWKYINCISLVLFFLLPLYSSAQERRPALISFNFYPYLADVKTDSDFTINTLVPLPARFSYFSFVNFGGLFHSGIGQISDYGAKLKVQIAKQYPIDLVIQDTIRNGRDNDTVHIGFRWRVNNTEQLQSFFNAIHLSYSVHVFPKRFDQRDVGGWQLSHAYQMTFPNISDRLYFSGFLDHNINESNVPGTKRDNIVSENQFGVRLFNKVYAVAEFRVNEYRRSDTTNFGVGLEIKTSW